MVGNTTIAPRAWAEAVTKPEINEVRSLRSGFVLNVPRLIRAFRYERAILLRQELKSLVKRGDAGQEIAERKDAFHLHFGKCKGCGNVLDAAAFLHKAGEALPLGDLVGVLSQQVLDHRDFQRLGIVAVADHDARQAAFFTAFLDRFYACEVATLACQYLEVIGLAICPDKERRQHTARFHRRQDVADIGHLAPAPHIDGGDGKAVQRNVVDLHDIYS